MHSFIIFFILLFMFVFFILPLMIRILNYKNKVKKILTGYLQYIPALSGSKIKFNSLRKTINNIEIEIKVELLNIYLEADSVAVKIKPLLKSNLDISVSKNDYKYNNSITKDDEFDRLVNVLTNNENEIILKLTKKIRIILISLISSYFNYNFNITNNVIHFSNSISNIDDAKTIFNNLLLITQVFFSPLNLQEIINNFKSENDIYVKKNILLELIKYYNSEEIDLEDEKRLIDFFNECKSNSSNIISIYSCHALGEKEIPRLIELLENSKDDEIVLIIDMLKEYYNHHEVSDTFYKILKNDKAEIQAELIKIFSFNKDKKSIKHIMQIFNINKKKFEIPEELKIELVRYFGQLRVKQSVNWLFSLLTSYDLIKIESIKALGKIRSLRAVEHLIPYTKGLNSNDIKNAAINSINKIQKNIPENFRGDLSVTDNIIKGELSITNNETGRLTIEEIKE